MTNPFEYFSNAILNAIYQSFTGDLRCRLVGGPVRVAINFDLGLVGSNGLFPCFLIREYFKHASFQNLTNPSSQFSRVIPFAKITF